VVVHHSVNSHRALDGAFDLARDQARGNHQDPDHEPLGVASINALGRKPAPWSAKMPPISTK
jgi:hypothetical protein